MINLEDLFLVSSQEIQPLVKLNVYFDKNMNFRENIKCYFQLEVELADNKFYKVIEDVRYINNDNIVSPDELMKKVYQLVKKVIGIIDSLNSGANNSEGFYVDIPGISDPNLEVRKDLKKSLLAINSFNLYPYIMQLYTEVLVNYKGTDTLQNKKFKKMVEAQTDAMIYNSRTGGNLC